MARDRDIELDPRFLVPPGVIDVRQENKDDSYQAYSPEDVVLPGDGPVLEFSNSTVPRAPSRYTIVSQNVRNAADGRTVVDVLLDFPDNMGEVDIDVRVTPA